MLPIAHLLVASLYLMGYCYAFGGNIWPFLSVSDLFSLSLGDVSFVYFTALVSAAAIVLGRARRGAWTVAEAVDKLPPGAEREQRGVASERLRKSAYLGDGFFVLLLVAIATAFYFTGGIVAYGFIGIAVAIVASNAVSLTCNRLHIHGLRFTTLSYVALFVPIVPFIGTQTAELDGHRKYNELAAKSSTCGKFAILRPFSPLFLVVAKDGRHYMIDSDCRPHFVVNRGS